jgi:hypothetical protein
MVQKRKIEAKRGDPDGFAVDIYSPKLIANDLSQLWKSKPTPASDLPVPDNPSECLDKEDSRSARGI